MAQLESNPFILPGNMTHIPVRIWLDNVRSALNVGSAFRTCDALGVDKIYLSGITCIPPHPEILKTALGSTLSVPWEAIQDKEVSLHRLKAEGWQIVLAEQMEGGTLLQDFPFNPANKYLLVFGNEVDGVQDVFFPFADAAVEIPQVGSKHSLNVSVAIGIVLWDAFHKFLT